MATSILVIGAGRSSGSLVKYLIDNSASHDWVITVADMDINLAKSKAGNNSNVKAISLDVTNHEACDELVQKNDLVVSMLPAFMHGNIAKLCVEHGKHLFTASYVSDEMRGLDEAAKKKEVLLMNEIGLDPGIDHASAMKIINELKKQGAKIKSFKSYCGGLVAPESNDNPWGYKLSWNPRNVILAGQGTARFIHNGKLHFIPYNRVFTDIETIELDGYGKFDAYANRDSISYIGPYGLDGVSTILRGTLRNEGYCKAWNVFVRLGLTDESFEIDNLDQLTYSEFLASYLPKDIKGASLKERIKNFMGSDYDAGCEEKLDYLEFFNDNKIPLKKASPAKILQTLLEDKWKLKPGDKDMIVMQHIFEYELNGKQEVLKSSLIVKGEDDTHTAMAKTVGLPLAITVKLFLEGKIKLSGVHIPVVKEIYEPLLAELEETGICFQEKKD